MIRKFLQRFSMIGFFILMTLTFGHSASAETIIADGAGLLTTDETNQIQSSCDTILERFQTSVYIVTSSEIGKDDDYKKYMESVAQNEASPKNLILLFISTKKGKEVCQIYGYGNAKNMLDKDRCNAIRDDMNNDLSDGDYYAALDIFCDKAQEYMGKNPLLDSIIFSAIPQLIFCLILACGIVYLMIRDNSGKKPTVANPYIDSNHSMLLGKIDHFTHKTVIRAKKAKRRKKEDNNSNSDNI